MGRIQSEDKKIWNSDYTRYDFMTSIYNVQYQKQLLPPII